MILLSRNTSNKLKTIISKSLKIKIIVRNYPGGSHFPKEAAKEAAKALGKNASSITPETGSPKVPTDPQTEMQKEISKPENNPFTNPVKDITKSNPEHVVVVSKHVTPTTSTPLKDQENATKKSLDQAEQHQKLQNTTQTQQAALANQVNPVITDSRVTNADDTEKADKAQDQTYTINNEERHQTQNPKEEISGSTPQTNNPYIQQANTPKPAPATQQINDPDDLELQQETTQGDVPVSKPTDNTSRPAFGLGAVLQSNPLYKDLHQTESKVEKKDETSYPNTPTSTTVTTTAITVSSTNSVQETNTQRNEESSNPPPLQNTGNFQPLDPNAPTPPLPPKPKSNPNYKEESKAFTEIIKIQQQLQNPENKNANLIPSQARETERAYLINEKKKKELTEKFPEDIRLIIDRIEQQQWISKEQIDKLIELTKTNENIALSSNLENYLKNIKLFDGVEPKKFHEILLKLLDEKQKIPEILLQKYRNYIKTSPEATLGDDKLTDRLNLYLQTIKLTKNNTKNNEQILNETEIQKRMRILKETEAPSRCFTLDDYKNERKRIQECLYLLKQKDLSDQDYIYLISQSKILQNPEVFHKGYYITVDLNKNKLILNFEEENFKKGEGLKLVHEGYFRMEQNPEKFPPKVLNRSLTQEDINTFFASVKQKKYVVGLLKRSDEELSDAVLLSGLDLHYIYFYEDPANPGYGFIFGMNTSANDGTTIVLSKTQEFNENPMEENRPQRARFPPKLIYVKKEDIFVCDNATKFAHGINKEGESINDKIVQSVEANLNHYNSKPLEEPQTITMDTTKILAEIVFNDMISFYETELNNLQKIEPRRLKDKMELQEKQKKNQGVKDKEQELKDSLDIEQKAFYDLWETLFKIRKKRANTNKISAEADLKNEKEKEIPY